MSFSHASHRPAWPRFLSRCLLATTVAALGLALLFPPGLAQQNPPEKEPARTPQSGMSTAGAHAPVKDALSRPITAGGFVDGAPVVFVSIHIELTRTDANFLKIHRL